ncbi:hypothetical protein HLI01_26820 [Rhizobium laguerreae]|uniref:hypothetical protein n=1 Tax=Rhizobium laguerreae TaxID=1076926 RepID=UPI0014781692|nr:hypothetical protein [Rhizobium laguerreae]NNH60345.1 hypothetical protein [Rhizobium laguerreae]
MPILTSAGTIMSMAPLDLAYQMHVEFPSCRKLRRSDAVPAQLEIADIRVDETNAATDGRAAFKDGHRAPVAAGDARLRHRGDQQLG